MHRDDREAVDVKPAGKLGGLVLLNGLLLLLLGVITFASPADAQMRTRGNYTMTGGGANGANSSVVWVVDTVNQELMAITYDTNGKELIGIGYRNLTADLAELQRGGPSR